MNNWDKKFIDLAHHVSTWSKDKSTKVGAIIVDNQHRILSTGYNGFPRGIDDDVESRHERPLKYAYTEHAERNAIYNAARNGVALKDSKLYVQMYPCVDCARAIIQSGIKIICVPTPDFKDSRWGDSFKISKELFKEAKILVEYI